MGRLGRLILLGAFFFAAPAQAVEGWTVHFVKGEYEEAARLARAHDTDESWAFAARATLARAATATLSKAQAEATYGRAEADARRAGVSRCAGPRIPHRHNTQEHLTD